VRRDLAEVYLAAGQIDDAIEALAPLVEQGDVEAARALADLYRQAGRLADRVALLASLPPATDRAQRVSDLREMAEVYGQQGARDAMLAALREILVLDPADPEALALVEDELRAQNAFDELRQVLYAAARAPGVPVDARSARLREIARLSEQRLGDAAGAVEAWRALLAVEPHDEEGVAALERLLTQAERWDELARWLEKRVAATTDRATQRALWERLAALHRDKRNDESAEAAALSALWALDPEDDAVALRLVDARRRLGDVAGVTEVLRARAEASAGAEGLVRWSELATHLEGADERDAAMQAWQQVATQDPAHAPAWEAIERLLELTGRHDLLLETLIAHAEGPAAGDRPASFHARAADVARLLGDVATATTQAERALQLAPDDDAVAELLADLYEAAGNEERLLVLLRERAAGAPDGDAKIAALRRMAHALGRRDPEEAARVWAELREVAKRAGKRDDVEALDALAGFAEVKGDHAMLADLLLESSVVASEPAQQRGYLLRRAEILAQELGRPDDAMATLRDIAERVDPRHAPAWGRLAEIARATGKPLLAAEALEQQAALVDDEEEKARVAARLAEVCEKDLQDLARTVAALEIWYDADPTDYTVVERLARLNEARGAWGEAIKYLEVLAEVEGDDDEVAAMVQRIAALAEEKLGSARKAFDVLAPHARNGDAAALDALRGVAERGGLVAELVPLLADLAGRVARNVERAALWNEVARRTEETLGDKRGALDAALKALISVPTDAPTLDRVLGLAGELRDAPRAAQAFSVALAATDDPAAVQPLALRAVEFLEGLGAAAAALDVAMAAQARLPGDEPLLAAIERLAPAAGRGDEMFIAFDRRRNATRDEAERYALVLRAARASALRLGDRETALGYLGQAAAQALAGKTPSEERLQQIAAMARDADQVQPEADLRATVVELLANLAEENAEDNPRASAALARHAALICRDDLALPEHAFALLSRAVTRWPADLAAAEALEPVAAGLGRGGEVAELYQRVIDDAYEAQTAHTYQARRAALLADKLGRVDDAIEALRGLVEIAPRDLDALRSLQGLLRRHGRHQDLLMALERELEIPGADRVATLKQVARVWEENLRNTFEARDAWKRVLKAAPRDAEAAAALERLEKRWASRVEDDAVETVEPEEIREGTAEVVAAPPDPGLEDEVITGMRTAAPQEISQTDLEPVTTGEILAPPPDPEPALAGEWPAAIPTGAPASERLDADATVPPSADLVGDTPVARGPEPTSEHLAPDVLEDLEALEAMDQVDAEAVEPEEIDAEPEEAEGAGDDLESLARMASRPPPVRASTVPPPPPRLTTSAPPPPLPTSLRPPLPRKN
jgi:hypothetical protein